MLVLSQLLQELLQTEHLEMEVVRWVEIGAQCQADLRVAAVEVLLQAGHKEIKVVEEVLVEEDSLI